MKDKVNDLKSFYSNWDVGSMDRLDSIYDENIVFEDPYHCVTGIKGLKRYFRKTMQGVNHCKFEFVDDVVADNKACLMWVMTYSHPRVSGGKSLSLNGSSWVVLNRSSQKIGKHKDYYDTAEMIFDHIPVVGWVTKRLKAGLARD